MCCRIELHDAHQDALLGPAHRFSCPGFDAFHHWLPLVFVLSTPVMQTHPLADSIFIMTTVRLTNQAPLSLHHQCTFELLPCSFLGAKGLVRSGLRTAPATPANPLL